VAVLERIWVENWENKRSSVGNGKKRKQWSYG
jgi:hypothetical protein